MKRAALVATLCVLAGASPGHAGLLKDMAAFQVNTYTMGDQESPDIASDGQSRFVMVWESDDQDGYGAGIFARRFTSGGFPVGNEFQVNSYTTADQGDPAVAMSPSGAFVVVWMSYSQDGDYDGVFARLFTSTGSPVGAEFQVNSYTTNGQYDPHVAIDRAGNFITVWTSYGQVGQGNSIFGRIFGSSGAPAGPEFQVDTYTSAYQYFPAVAGDEMGNFAVVWESYPTDGDGFGIAARLFDRTGAPAGPEFQVNTYTPGDQGEPGIAMNAVGDFLVAWDGDDQDGSQDGVFAQVFDVDGVPVGTELQVNTYTMFNQEDPKVAADPSGEFIVVWPSQNQDGSQDGVFGQIVDSLGMPLGIEFQVSSYATNNQNRPTIATGPPGSFIVAWEDASRDGSSYGVFGQSFIAHSPELLGPAGPLDCSDPSNPGTLPTFTWDTDTYDAFKLYMGSSAGFEQGTRVTSGDAAIRTGSWTPSKKKWKSACKKALTQAADPNNPVMFVVVGGLDQDLDKKNPSRKRLSPVVQFDVNP